MEKYLHLLSRGDKIGLTLIRLSIAIVFMWIGLLKFGNDSNLLIVFYVQIMPDDFVMQLHRF